MPDDRTTWLIRTILFGIANAAGTLVLMILLLNPNRPLGPILGLLAAAVGLWALALWIGWRK